MALVGERFDDYVQLQIESRQQTQGSGFNSNRTPEQQQLLNNKNAWLKVASSVFVDPQSQDEKDNNLAGYSNTGTRANPKENSDRINYISIGEKRLRDIGFSPIEDFTGNQLARRAILFNTLSSLSGKTYEQRSGVSKRATNLWNNNSYGLGGDGLGIVPSPGVVSFNVESQNRGSIREANLKIKCYNRFQFDLIEILYLRLGYSLMIEWGWNKYSTDGGQTITTPTSTLIENEWFKDNSLNQIELIRAIEKEREKNQGNYDGFFGKIVNFNWEITSNGEYEIDIKLVTVGGVIESLMVNTREINLESSTLNKLIKNFTEEGEDNYVPGISESSIITTAGDSALSIDLFTDIATTKLFDKENLKDNGSDYIDASIVFDFDRTDKDKEAEGKKQTLNRYNYYCTLGELLKKIQTVSIPLFKSKGGGEYRESLVIDTQLEKNISVVYPNHISLDPRVCLIKPYLQNSKPSHTSLSDLFSEKSDFVYRDKGWNKFRDYVIEECVGENNDSLIYGQIMNIYINYEFISLCLDKNIDQSGTLSLFNFLTSICDGINKSLGYANNLEVVILDDYKVTIQDQNPIPGISQSSQFSHLFSENPDFELFGYDVENNASNFVKNFGFKTSLTPKTGAMISIGATAAGTSTKNYDGTAFSKWNEGLIDRYAEEYIDPQIDILAKQKRQRRQEADELGIQPTSYLTALEAYSLYENYKKAVVNTSFWEKTKSVFSGAKSAVKYGGFNTYTNTAIASVGYLQSQREYKSQKGSTTALGVELVGPRDPGKFGNFPSVKNITWADYVERYELFVINSIAQEASMTIEKLFSKYKDNYLFYLVDALGGRFSTTKSFNVGPLHSIKPSYWDYDPEKIKIGIKSFQSYVTSLNNYLAKHYGTPSPTIGFIPANLNITMQGLSGIKIYQALKVRQKVLPPQYPEALMFLIESLNHEISNDEWQTTVNTLSVPNVSLVPINATLELFNEAVENMKNEKTGIPEYVGPTPNADIVRTWIAENGTGWLTEKEAGADGVGGRTSPIISDGELSSGGDITLEAARMAIQVVDAIHKEYPYLDVKFTAGNDLFHQNNLGSAASRHRTGKAIDIVIDPAENKDVANVKKVLGGFIVNPNSNIWYLDEYGDPTDDATGKHFHFSYATEEGAGYAETQLAIEQFKNGDIKKQPEQGLGPEIPIKFTYRAIERDVKVVAQRDLPYIRETYSRSTAGSFAAGTGSSTITIYDYKATITARITPTQEAVIFSSLSGYKKGDKVNGDLITDAEVRRKALANAREKLNAYLIQKNEDINSNLTN